MALSFLPVRPNRKLSLSTVSIHSDKWMVMYYSVSFVFLPLGVHFSDGRQSADT